MREQHEAEEDPAPVLSSEQMIARDMHDLTIEERENVYEEIHGVSGPILETPILVQESLQAMDQAIYEISDRHAYDQAKLLSPAFVMDTKFRLSFLRAERFNAKQAAARITKYFKFKLELFGIGKLVKKITWDDLDEDTRRVVEQGCIQVLSSRDSQGRAVAATLPGFLADLEDKFVDPKPPLIRGFFFMLSCLSEDEETQKNGVVCISYAVDMVPPKNPKQRASMLWSGMKLCQVLPFRISSLHFCHNSSIAGRLLQVITYAAGSLVRVKIRVHLGSHEDCQYKLMTFGIPVQAFPIRSDGTLNHENHTKWLDRRKKKEKYMAANPFFDNGIDLPTRADVLLGRGRPFINHPGNKRLHQIIHNRYEEYDGSSFQRKTKISKEILEVVQKYGGKFLKLDNVSGMWLEAPEIEARNKVSHSFRRKRADDGQEAGIKVERLNEAQDVGGGKRLRGLVD